MLNYLYKKIFIFIIIIIIILLFIFYVYYTHSYNYFILSELTLLKISIKIYYLKKEYNKQKYIFHKQKQILNIDDIYYHEYLEYLNKNYNNNLRLINIEVEKIKNLNKIYNKKCKILLEINKIKKDYLTDLKKIQKNGYNNILLLEKHKTYLLSNLYTYYLSEMQSEIQIQNNNNKLIELYKLDMKSIKDNYDNNFKIKKLKSCLKKKIYKNKKRKCNLHISWKDEKYKNIYCCNL